MDTKTATCNCNKDQYGFKCKCFKFKPSSSGGRARPMIPLCDLKSLPLPPMERLSSDSSASSDGRPRKRALLCGVTYKNWKHKLHGPVNDVMRMQDFLIDYFDYPKQNIRILTEEETDPDRVPTKKNIQSSLKWLVEGCEGGERLVFYFSGHGLRQPDFAMDELDGYDETICPMDFLEKGMISDNEINATIVWPLKKDVMLHAIVDACHSGTILDLACVYDLKRNVWMDNRPPSGARKGTSGGIAISLCACGDDEYAADTSILTGKKMNGAMTLILIELVMNSKKLTYGRLLASMQEEVKRANRRGCIACSFLRKLFGYKQIQEPQLSSSEEFDVHKKIFEL